MFYFSESCNYVLKLYHIQYSESCRIFSDERAIFENYYFLTIIGRFVFSRGKIFIYALHLYDVLKLLYSTFLLLKQILG